MCEAAVTSGSPASWAGLPGPDFGSAPQPGPTGEEAGDGDPVGEPVGDPVGEPVGDPVGEPVGDPVGDPVGEAVGDGCRPDDCVP
ncbi:hypothetical protein Skr01_73410 [Sphaerisporangium krabiense]|nr:hypothetical protein Skr01_73410 [Sphaerisporangium krabiense]